MADNRGNIYSGARAVLYDSGLKKYRIVKLLITTLLEDDLYFTVKDVNIDAFLEVRYSKLMYGFKKREGNEDFYTLDKWREDVSDGYISDYDGSASFCDDEYVYNYPDPFDPNVLEECDLSCFSGVVFYGR